MKTIEVLELYFLGDLKHRQMKDQAVKKCLALKCLNHILEDTCEYRINTFILNLFAGILNSESEFLRHLKTCFSLGQRLLNDDNRDEFTEHSLEYRKKTSPLPS